MKDILTIIKEEIPVDFFIQWKNSLNNSYGSAISHIATGNFEFPQAKNLLPYEYNAFADQTLKKIARQFPCFEIIDAQIENGYSFTILYSDSVILTQKATASPNSMVDISCFRKSLARGNAIYCDEPTEYLFPMEAMKKDRKRDKIYGILTHNRASVFVKGENPFSYISFPDPTFNYYIENIDLDDYCDSMNRIKIVEKVVAEIKDEAIPQLKIGITMEDAK